MTLIGRLVSVSFDSLNAIYAALVWQFSELAKRPWGDICSLLNLFTFWNHTSFINYIPTILGIGNFVEILLIFVEFCTSFFTPGHCVCCVKSKLRHCEMSRPCGVVICCL